MSLSSRLYERAQRVKHAFLERVSTLRAKAKREKQAQNAVPIPLDALEPRLLMSSTVGGFVFADHNANGLQDADERGLPHMVVYVDDNLNGERDQNESFTTTDKEGLFSFSELPDGPFRLAIEEDGVWNTTTPKHTFNGDSSGGSKRISIGVQRDQVIGNGDHGLFVLGEKRQSDVSTAEGTEKTLNRPGHAWARWSYDDLENGQYSVFARWNASEELATDAPYTIYDGDKRIEIVRVDQTTTGDDRVDSEGNWHLIGVFDIADGSMTVEVNLSPLGSLVHCL